MNIPNLTCYISRVIVGHICACLILSELGESTYQGINVQKKVRCMGTHMNCFLAAVKMWFYQELSSL